MLVSFWSSKGGTGTSLVAASVAREIARQHGSTRLVDCDGEIPALVGLAEEPELGLAQWLESDGEAAAEALDRLTVDVGSGVELLPLGVGAFDGASTKAVAALTEVLRTSAAVAVADAGVAVEPARTTLVESSDAAVLVLRNCYLALRRAVGTPVALRSRGVVVVEEPGRALRPRHVAEIVGLPLLGTIPVRASISRAVDAGVLLGRPPTALVRATADVVEEMRRLSEPAR